MLVIDKYTMCFKPALFDASTTRRITPDRNSPISSPSAGHGEDASIATSAPAKAASKPSPVVISTPVERDISTRSEEHTSELQSRGHLVCRLLLAKTKQAATQSTCERREAGAREM